MVQRMRKLWYKAPARFFEESLPIGNGRLGGMHYAGTASDRVSLNEDTLWSGFPRNKSAEAPYESVCRAKELMRNGRVAEAENELCENVLGEWTEAYQPAGSLSVNLGLEYDFFNFHRELDLNNAVARSEFFYKGYKYEREVFCSAADNVLVYSFETDNPDNEAELLLSSPHPSKNVFENGIYIMHSIAPYYAAPVYFECDNPVRYDSFENNRALSYCVGIKPVVESGEVLEEKGALKIKARKFYLILDIETNFAGFEVKPQDSTVDYKKICTDRLSAAAKYSLCELKSRHIADHTSLFERVELHIEGASREHLPTDERLTAYGADRNDIGLPVLVYDYARYLAIASSRQGTQPSNLQGIWNESVRAPWSSNYTLNINTEMNYWHIEKCNLSECHLPLIKMLSELARNGSKTAAEYYRVGGWCSHHNTDIWRQTEPVGKGGMNFPLQYAFWNMSGCWLATHIWEHYKYTADKEFLRENFDTLKGSVEFLAKWMERDENGQYITPLTTSPENTYLLEDGKHALSRGCAMDQGIANELFGGYIRAAEILGLEDDVTELARTVLKDLKPYGIDDNGALIEWDTFKEEEDPQHRHISLLYGLYPGNSINESTPELMKASEVILNRRGNEATGWALGWRICCWARLKNSGMAKLFVDKLLRMTCATETEYSGGGGLYPNLLAAHPPYQIDANFAFAAGINEMLLQSFEGKEIPLPALPEEWSKGGYLKGIKLDRGRIADLEWKNGKVVSFEIRA